jgi:hypothetical protein
MNVILIDSKKKGLKIMKYKELEVKLNKYKEKLELIGRSL